MVSQISVVDLHVTCAGIHKKKEQKLSEKLKGLGHVLTGLKEQIDANINQTFKFPLFQEKTLAFQELVTRYHTAQAQYEDIHSILKETYQHHYNCLNELCKFPGMKETWEKECKDVKSKENEVQTIPSFSPLKPCKATLIVTNLVAPFIIESKEAYSGYTNEFNFYKDQTSRLAPKLKETYYRFAQILKEHGTIPINIASRIAFEKIDALAKEYNTIVVEYRALIFKTEQANENLKKSLNNFNELTKVASEKNVYQEALKKAFSYISPSLPIVPQISIRFDFEEPSPQIVDTTEHMDVDVIVISDDDTSLIEDVPESPESFPSISAVSEKTARTHSPEIQTSPKPCYIDVQEEYTIDGFSFKMSAEPLDVIEEEQPSKTSVGKKPAKKKAKRTKEKEVEVEDESVLALASLKNATTRKAVSSQSSNTTNPRMKQFENLMTRFLGGNASSANFKEFTLEEKLQAISLLDAKKKHPYIELIKKINTLSSNSNQRYVTFFRELLDEVGFNENWSYEFSQRSKSKFEIPDVLMEDIVKKSGYESFTKAIGYK